MRTLLSSFIVILLFSSSLDAQPPWERGRDGGRRDWGRDSSRDRGRDWASRMDPSAMLRRADKNGDGRVDPNEIDERFKGFTNRMLERYGFDPNKPVNLDALSKKWKAQTSGKEEEKKEEDVSTTFGIPGFDDVDDSLPPMVPDFFLQPDSPLLMAGSIEKRYEKFILDQVDRTLRMYDRNRDGKLDNEEIRRGRFTSPPVEQSDLDKDGNLSKVELAERYVARSGNKGRIESGKKSSSSSSSSRSRSSDWRSRYERKDSSSKKEEPKKSYSRSSRTSSSSRSSSSRSSSSSRNDKIVSYAKSILSKYDKNGDKILDSKESENIRSLPPGADKNKDGKISLDELVVGFGGTSSSSSRGSSRSRDGSNNPYIVKRGMDRSAEADRDFQELDKNVDGLIQMHEFAKSWTDEIAENFVELDKNDDGVVTISEWSKGGGKRSSSRSSRSGSRSSYRSSRGR